MAARSAVPLVALIALMLTPLASVQAAPALIVLLRHGHKDRSPGPAGVVNYNLSPSGFRQALLLAQLIPACLQRDRPLQLISHGLDPLTGKNARSYQTLVPLAVSSGVNIRLMQSAADDSERIGSQLRDDPSLSGAVVVIAWEHRRLPALARGLGWAAMPAVAEDDFDSLWLLHYANGGGPLLSVVRSQSALLLEPCARRWRRPGLVFQPNSASTSVLIRQSLAG